jgi:uncharacterized membrane protein
MITTGFGYVSFLICFLAFAFWFTKKYPWKIFNVIPPIIIVYIGSAVLASFKFYAANDSVGAAQTMITRQFLPTAIILLLMICDFQSIMRLGPKLLCSFFLSAFSVTAAFIIIYALFKGILPEYAPKTLAVLSATWIGGTQNLMAAAALMDAQGVELNFAILVDTVLFSAWLGLLLMTVKFKDQFNKWTGASTQSLETVLDRLARNEIKDKTPEIGNILITLAIGMGGTWLCTTLGNQMPTVGSINQFGWCVLFCMFLGTLLSFTPARKLNTASMIGTLFLYLLLANLGSWADFGAIVEAPSFMVVGILIMLLHAVIFLLFAKIFRLDAFSVWVADIATIGGEATAPTVAGAFDMKLAPIGILMGLTGVLVGTYFSLAIEYILLLIQRI